VELATPFHVTAGTMYVASYGTSVSINQSEYYAVHDYFVPDHISGPLTAPGTGSPGGPAGVYSDDGNNGNSAGLFPTNVFDESNYYVDVIFHYLNAAPSGADNTITLDEDTAHTFTAADFGFSDVADPDPSTLAAVIITTLPTNGTLKLNNVVVTADQSIAFGNIGNLVFTPDPDANGLAYASFTFQVQDDGGTIAGGQDTDQSANTITLNVTPVDDDTDADVGDDAAVSISEAVINATEVGTVEYIVLGVDLDATAEVTFTSSGGGTPVVVSGLGNGTTNVDLSSLPDGTISASIVVTDNASNTASGTGDIASLDTIADAAPVASVVFDDGDGFVSASEAATAGYTTAGVDGDATATVTFSDGNPLHDVVVSGLGNGTFSANLSGLTDGPITASISITDNAGNTANGTGDNSTKDTTADGAPPASVTFNDGDGFVSAAEAATVSYTIAAVDGDATATVTFSDGNVLHDVTVAGLGNGGFSADLSGLTDGPITASIVVSDTAGNSAAATGDTSIKDMTADSPADLALAINDGDGFISAAEAATVSYTIAGVDADATATVTFSDGTVAHDVVVSGLGNGGFTANLSGLTDGPITASISSTDTAGNTAPGTGDFSTKDTTADNSADLGVSVADELVNNAEKGSVAYTVSGLDADATATVTFSDGNGHSVNGVDGLADLSTLDDGPISVTISATDLAGNTAPGTGDSLTLDTTADVDDDLSVSVADDLVNNAEKGSVTYTVSGLDPDATATVTFTDSLLNSVIGVGGTADLSTLADGVISVSISATDTSGNSASGAGDALTLDTVIATPTVALTNDSGTGGDLLTNDASLTLSVPAGDVTRSFVIDGGAPSASYTAPTGQGSHTVQVIDTDTAGNTANASTSFTLDTGIPSAPEILLAEDNVGSETGNLSSGATTDDRIPVLRVGLTGTNAAAGDSVRIFSGASFLVTALISANDLNNGYVSVTLPSRDDDTYNFTAKVIDIAGNASGASAAFTLNVEADTGLPPTAIGLSNSTVIENAANALVGTLSANDPDAGDSFIFTLLDDAGGRFVIDGDSLRTTGPLDLEGQEFWNVEVQVTDSENNIFQDTIQIQVLDVNGFTIKGTQGNDVISAAKSVVGQHKATGEEDTILGRGGNDKIDGAGGNDTIRGGAGDDKITGGLGVDQLFGNAGADKFIFRSLADSLVADADTINGFSHSQHDKIDLRGVAVDALGAGQHFTFIGNTVFGNHAGELRYDEGLDLVQVDTDGNGTADFAIHVAVVNNLVRGDFLL
jgi:hypothetical protein